MPGVFTDKPSAPEGPLEVSDVWAEQVKLSWKPPKDNGGGEISGNSASARKQTLTEVEVLDANSNTSHVNCLVSGYVIGSRRGSNFEGCEGGGGGGGKNVPDAIFNTHLVNCLVSGYVIGSMRGSNLGGGGGSGHYL